MVTWVKEFLASSSATKPKSIILALFTASWISPMLKKGEKRWEIKGIKIFFKGKPSLRKLTMGASHYLSWDLHGQSCFGREDFGLQEAEKRKKKEKIKTQ